MSALPTGSPDLVERRIEDWRRRLIDLSNRNRLIAYKATKATTLEIAAPSIHEVLADPDRSEPWDFYLPPEPEEEDATAESDAAAAVDRLLVASQDRERLRRPNEIEVTEANPKRIARILDNLAKRSNSEFQDKALRILYIAAGFLDWHDAQRDKAISSPLVLVPVELRRESTRDPYRLFFVDDEEIVVNPSLTEKLRRDAGLDMPGDWTWEDKPIGQELEEIREAVRPKGWTVREEAAIGLFSFQKYVMYRDLLDHEDRVAAHPIVRSLAHGTWSPELRGADPDVPEPEQLDEVQAPEDALSILDADASQRQCVEAAKRGRSFVMQGPPGTGKSQTIANVIAEAIGQGKRVLFVSEKAAALDVVFKRLSVSGLDEYCLMLHGEHAGRREVVQALDRSLVSSLQPRPGMRSDEIERLRHLRTVLNDSAELLHLPQPLLGGRSLREVHEQLARWHDAPSIAGAPPADALEGEEVLDEYQVLNEVFQRLSERWHVSPSDYLWRGYAGERFTADDHGRVLAVLRDLRDAVDALEPQAAETATAIGSPLPGLLGAAQRLVELGDHLEHAPPLEEEWLDLPSGELLEVVNAGQESFEQLAGSSEAFARAFPARRIDDFSPDTEAHLRERCDEVRRRAGWAPAWEGDLAALPAALRCLDDLPELIAALRQRASSTAQELGQPSARLTARRIDELAELAELSFKAEERPESEWLVRAGLERARRALSEITDDLTSYQRRREELLEHYVPQALELDAAAMAERFSRQYTSAFSKLSSSYRRDAKAIKATRKDGKLPERPTEDLTIIAFAREVGERIDGKIQRLAPALGSYAAGRDSDPQAIARAIATAERVGELTSADAALSALADHVAVGSPPQPALAQAADQLRHAKRALLDRLRDLERFVDISSGLFGGHLDELEQAIEDVGPALRELARAIDDLNTGASTQASELEEIRHRAALVDRVHRERERVQTQSAEWREVVGPSFAAEATDWEAIRGAARWIERLNTLTGGAIPSEVRRRLRLTTRTWPAFSTVEAGCDRMRRAIEQLTSLFEQDRATALGKVCKEGTFVEVRQLVERLAERVDELRDWTEWRAWRQRAERHGWGNFVDALVDAGVAAAKVMAAFGRSYWNRRLETLFAEEPELAEDLRGGAFQRWVDEFRHLDRKLVRTGADRLIARRERDRTSHVSTPGSEIDLLRREARKKRRHLPVRVLLSRIPTLLSDLKPCLMMSPLTVSHFLSPEHTFDLVVFDEASQVPPQDAVNCIYRGAQLVVAGDSKQLPPTPFFQIAELDELAPEEEDDSTQEDMESILDSCEALLPSHGLRWHYRSRSEPLIAFSNRQIYDGSLVTFPSAEQSTERMGIGFVHVADGVYDRGRSASNRREAQVAASRVMHHLTDGTRRSVGVIAFNSAQANAIGEELDLLKVRHPELERHFRGDRLDGVFVKHLEAVQGDERDVIVFSVGYGPDASGKFTTNFGPLNKDGGQRRLNVAVTRARERLELVSSVRSHDFQLSDSASAGARMLRDYVAYAEAHGEIESDEQAEEVVVGFPSPLEEQVAEAIIELGYHVVPSVGVGSFRIDLGVRAPGGDHRYLLGIECDGQGYAQTATARDRERLRHEVLDGLGWGPIHRIWSLDWVRNRFGEIARVREALSIAEARQAVSPDASVVEVRDERPSPADEVDQPRDRVERVVHELGTSTAAAALPWTELYERTTLGSAGSYYEFHESVNRRVQTDMLVDLLAVEAPVSIDYAIRRLAEAWGLQRAGHRVVSAGRQAVSQAVRREAAEIRSEFLWRPGQTLSRVRVPDPERLDRRREIEDIAPEELDLAIARLREASAGLDDEQLLSQVARVFGFDRTGGRIRTALEERLAAERASRRHQ